MQHDDELTPAEREAFEALSRERDPGRRLEERTVRALREEGLLGRRARPWFTPFRLAVAGAATMAIFAAGAFTGAALLAGPAAKGGPARSLAASVERVRSTSHDYAAALGSLAGFADSTAAYAAGRDVALAGLRGVAGEAARVAPGEPALGHLLNGLGGRDELAAEAHGETGRERPRRVLWL